MEHNRLYAEHTATMLQIAQLNATVEREKLTVEREKIAAWKQLTAYLMRDDQQPDTQPPTQVPETPTPSPTPEDPKDPEDQDDVHDSVSQSMLPNDIPPTPLRPPTFWNI